MCLLGVFKASEQRAAQLRVPFVFFSNRDEYYARTTGPIGVLEDGIVAALDERRAGTWVGLNTRTGRFATLTNVSGLTDDVDSPIAPHSRGTLILNLLRGAGDDAFRSEPLSFGGFNLLLGSATDGSRFRYATNRLLQNEPVANPDVFERTIDEEFFSIASAQTYRADVSERVPKVRHVETHMPAVVERYAATASSESDIERLRDELAHVFCDTTEFATGSSVFANGATAGTVAQTMLARIDDTVHYYYRTCLRGAITSDWQHFAFPVPPRS